MATRISIFACVVILIIPCMGETKVDDDLAVYLPFDSGTGKVAKDVTEHGNDGQFMGTVEWGVGKFDGGSVCRHFVVRFYRCRRGKFFDIDLVQIRRKSGTRKFDLGLQSRWWETAVLDPNRTQR